MTTLSWIDTAHYAHISRTLCIRTLSAHYPRTSRTVSEHRSAMVAHYAYITSTLSVHYPQLSRTLAAHYNQITRTLTTHTNHTKSYYPSRLPLAGVWHPRVPVAESLGCREILSSLQGRLFALQPRWPSDCAAPLLSRTSHESGYDECKIVGKYFIRTLAVH